MIVFIQAVYDFEDDKIYEKNYIMHCMFLDSDYFMCQNIILLNNSVFGNLNNFCGLFFQTVKHLCVYVCMYVCVCVHVYMCTCVHVYVRICMYRCIKMVMHFVVYILHTKIYLFILWFNHCTCFILFTF